MTGRGSLSLVLASGSPARLRLLRQAGFDPEVVVSNVDESNTDDLDVSALVQQLAERKAAAVAPIRPLALVLGCDSMLDVDTVPIGKPDSPEAAAAIWHKISGRQATLLTGHCLIDGGSGRRVRGTARTVVRFAAPSQAEIAAYVASGEPMTMAGGFSLEGLGAPFVDGIDGDPSNVIGLSLPLLRRMLADLGIAITDLWRTG